MLRATRAAGRRALLTTLALAALLPATPAVADPPAALELRALSNRADLVSGGDVLLEVVLPPDVAPADVRVALDGVDATAAFAPRPDGRFYGLLDGLRLGQNAVTAHVRGGPPRAAVLDVTNHPRSGPVLSGPHLSPHQCSTVEAGLGEPLDASCSAATRHDFFFRNAATGQFEAYDPAAPPPPRWSRPPPPTTAPPCPTSCAVSAA